jgi:L-threonylcarbamoyladenylate synthase
MQFIKPVENNFELIIKTLNRGGLIIFPCETVYGAGVDPGNLKAVKKLTEYKQRPWGKPYAIMVSSQKMAEKYADLNDTAKNLYKNFLPGPLTIVSFGKHKLAKGMESELGTLGIRIPKYTFLLRLISSYGKPIAATSANASYKKRPYTIPDILDSLSEKQKKLIDLIIDAGELPHNDPSTVIDTTPDDPVVLRQGVIKINSGDQITSRSEENTRNTGKELWQKYEKYLGSRAVVFALEGPMGAGKTQFTKGLARAMGIKDEIISPTFNLELDYEGKLFHFDAWRLSNGEELERLGLKGLINNKSVIAIEWADRVADSVRKYNEEAVIVWVKIKYGHKDTERVISWGTL